MPNLPYRPPPVARGPIPTVDRRGPTRATARAARRASCVVLSAAVHLVALLILGRHIAGPQLPRGTTSVIDIQIRSEVAAIRQQQPDEPQQEPQEREPIEAPPDPQPPPIKPAPPAPDPPAPDVPDKMPTTTVQATPVVEVADGPEAARGLFDARSSAAHGAAVARRGGTSASENAVDAALKWLERNQAPDGHWTDGDPQLKLAPSLTGLAVLAFLARSHTHLAEGPFRPTVARGIGYLLRIQSPDGRFGEPHDPANNPYLMYHQGIATLALAEAYAMTQDAKLSAPVRRAVAFIQAAQQRSGGWDYSNRPTGRSDTSVTGWQLMALKSAHAAGLEVDWRTLLGVLRHIDAMTNPSGDVHYADRARYASRRGPGMMAVGMLCHQMLGWPRNSPILRQQAIRLLRNLPDWVTARSREPYSHLHTMYYWYHGTLAMFNVGGPAWAAWNAHTRDLLVAQQHLEGRRRGSWEPPSGGFDSVGGRVYATAICALTLEVYYRYLPFHTTRGFDALDVLQRAARVQGSPERRVAIRVLGQLNDERARAILVEALDDPSRAIRSIARAALVAQRSDKVLPVLLKDLAAADPTTRLHAISALDKLAFPSLIPLLVKALRDPDKTVRHRAIIALRRSTHQDFGYRHDALPAERELAVVKWEQWWRACRAAPPPEGIRGTVLVVDAEMPDAPVLSVGLEDGVRRGLRFEVRRGERTVAIVEADHVAAGITIGRVVEARAEPIRVDDEVRSIAEPASPPAKQ